MPSLIGTNPDQLPVCGMLGTLAFQDNNAVQITGGKIGGVDVAAIASAVLTGEETDTINSSANLVLRGGGVNLLKYSEQFDNSAWFKILSTITANAVVSPDGTVNADKLIANTEYQQHYVRNAATTAASANIAYTASVYVKAAEYTQFELMLMFDPVKYFARGFDLTTGLTLSTSIGDATDAGSDATITHVGNGWYRCSITKTVSLASNLHCRVYTRHGGTTVYTGDGTSGIYIWGAQLVPGTSPGPYTKTESVAITSAGQSYIDAPVGAHIRTNSTSPALTITQDGTGNALEVRDVTGDGTPFVVDADGNVTVGSGSELAGFGRFQVLDTAPFVSAIGNYANDAHPGILSFVRSKSGTAGVNTGIAAPNDGIGEIRFYGSDGAQPIRAAAITAAVDGTPGTNDMPGRLVFSTTADGASSPTERMRIDSSGNVGISSQLIVGTAVSTGVAAIEVGMGRAGDGVALIDLHAQAGQNFNSRLTRDSGANGDLSLINSGAGRFSLQLGGAEQLGVSASGAISVASNAVVTNLNADLLDGQHGSYYQPALTSGSNIKTINGASVLGPGNIEISSSGGGGGLEQSFLLMGA